MSFNLGFILILIAVKYIAEVVGDPKVFNNMIIAVVLAIVGLAIGGIVVFGAFYSLVGLGSIGTLGAGTTSPSGFSSLFAAILIGLAVIWIFYLIASIFLRRSYNTIATRLKVGSFHTAGLLYLIGAAVTIIFVGMIIVFIAEILQIVAFFSIPEQVPTGPQPTPGQMNPPPSSTM